jgi:hypothetical protein
MTARSENLVKAPLIGTIAILAAGLSLMVAAGPAIAAERGSAPTSFSTNPPVVPQVADAA